MATTPSQTPAGDESMAGASMPGMTTPSQPDEGALPTGPANSATPDAPNPAVPSTDSGTAPSDDSTTVNTNTL